MRKAIMFVNCMLVSLSLTSPGWADASKGEQYFQSADGGNCTSCHYTDSRRLAGPGLRDVTERHSSDWLKQFLKDPQATWAGEHPETLELKKRVRKERAPITSCKKGPMTGEQIQDLVDYLATLKK